MPAPKPWHGCLALALTLLVTHGSVTEASAARTVYFADPSADVLAQFNVGPTGALTPLAPETVPAINARRLAMTPEGTDLYATAGGAVLQYDVAADGRLTTKSPALLPVDGDAHSIAVHPNGQSAYVTDHQRGQVRQYDVGAGRRLEPKDPGAVNAGERPTGIAVSPDGRTAYVLVAGGIAVFDIDSGGELTRRADGESIASGRLQDVALTPDGQNLYVTALDGRVLQFGIGTNGTLVPRSPVAVEVKSGAAPVGIAIAPDGSSAYVAARGWAAGGARHIFTFAVEPDGRLSRGDIAHAGARPFGLWYLSTTPDGRTLFVAGGDGHLFDLGARAALSAKAPASVNLPGAVGVVVSPNQSPVASFAIADATAGTPVQFDASSAGDVDGTIVRYDWDFGDGQTAPDGGPTPTHVYAFPGTYTVTLVVTDNEGASTATVFTGGTVLGHGTPGAVSSRQIEVKAPPEAAAPLQPEPVPDLGETLVAQPQSGNVRVRLRGKKRFRPLATIRELPLGSTLDTRRGRVTVSTIRDRRNRVQKAVFYSGVFTVRQRVRERYVTELLLRGRVGRCKPGDASASATRRRLWGSGKGRYRSRGNNSSATVRGTVWLTEDRCDGTLTRVRSGVVTVRDFVLNETVVLEAGERYLARAARP
jgi:DNA-binding beta-propeller fold protein YncE